MEILKDRYTITELSERLHVTDHTLRYYEKEFGLPVPKDGRGRRFYPTELANILFQITKMRSDGLEIKAIKKILHDENIVPEPPPVVVDDGSVSLVPAHSKESSKEIQQFFDDFKVQITASVSAEVTSAREQITREIYKSKLELGACVENGMRKLETKLDRHFQEVDRALGQWREKNKRGFVKKIMGNVFDR